MTKEVIEKIKELALKVQDAYRVNPAGSFEVYKANEDFRRFASPVTIYRLCLHIEMLDACIADLNEELREHQK